MPDMDKLRQDGWSYPTSCDCDEDITRLSDKIPEQPHPYFPNPEVGVFLCL